MSPRMSQACAMVLLLAMAFAMAAGLLAWGPVPITPADHRFADERASFGLPHFVNVLSCLPLLAVSLLGLRATARGTWPAALRAPWLAFFAMCAALSAAGIAYHVDPGDVGFVLTHLFAAGALTTLTLGFLAERVDALFGHVRALAAGCGAVGSPGCGGGSASGPTAAAICGPCCSSKRCRCC